MIVCESNRYIWYFVSKRHLISLKGWRTVGEFFNSRHDGFFEKSKSDDRYWKITEDKALLLDILYGVDYE